MIALLIRKHTVV